GLRRNELERMKVGWLTLEGDAPCLTVPTEPGHKGGGAIPLLPDHAAELSQWIADVGKNKADLVFYVPEKPNKILRRDLKAAGIRYRDDEGRYFDFHSLRHCTDTYLNAAGVPPSVVMLFMRHRHVKLSLQTYNDPRVHDLRKALEALPILD